MSWRKVTESRTTTYLPPSASSALFFSAEMWIWLAPWSVVVRAAASAVIVNATTLPWPLRVAGNRGTGLASPYYGRRSTAATPSQRTKHYDGSHGPTRRDNPWALHDLAADGRLSPPPRHQ